MISKTMRAILHTLSYGNIEVESSRRLVDIKKLDAMNIFLKKMDIQIFNGDYEIPLRIYFPTEEAMTNGVEKGHTFPVLLFFHGGGWVTESVDTYNRVCARMSQSTGHIVVSVEYRLAPEYRFPTALMDCYAAAKALYTNKLILNTDPRKITIMGDSAGGNLAAAIVLITINIMNLYGGVLHAFRYAAFQVVSVITTTGFVTANFDLWPEFSKTILLMLMVVGACAGSTGGGMKVSRYIIYFKTLRKELSTLIHPRSVKVIQCDGKAVDHDTIRSANIYLIAYIFIYMLSVLLISFDKFDLTTNFTAVAATFNNIGPGLNVVGPTGNFAGFSMFSKIVLIFDMLAGRLEIFPMLILLAPGTWKK